MKLIVNNQEKELSSRKISELIRELEIGEEFIAVAVNGKVVRRSNWQEIDLSDGDRIDIMSPVGGG